MVTKRENDSNGLRLMRGKADIVEAYKRLSAARGACSARRLSHTPTSFGRTGWLWRGL
jgi:hypothetical protein